MTFPTIKEIFLKRKYTDKVFSPNKDQKCSLQAKILDPFNTKSYVKIFLVP